MAKITKKQQKDFEQQVHTIMEKYGCREEENSSYTHAVDTNVGKVLIHVDDNTGSTVYAVYVYFEDHEKALQQGLCRSSNAKYNILSFNMLDVLLGFNRLLRKIV
ncbi:hypothetical protein [Bacillus cereus]|uniref:hypothetical protein n=1 Tax=Bacillus cereus TaxID=1396 RepID=UPI000BFC46D2|nr:hypothetical protein [Bacillus cereus]PGR83511.1 hypothetical protein COC63_05865 [Bacillus cereus]